MKVGDSFPHNVVFKYIPIIKDEPPLACRQPILFKFDQQLAKATGNIAIVAVPGAFTPTCTENHIPPFLHGLLELLKQQGISQVVILSANDPFVLSAWGKLLLQQAGDSVDDSLFEDNRLVFALDPNAEFGQKNGLLVDALANGMGIRTQRFAMVVGKDRKVKYLGVEKVRGVSVSGYDAVIKAKL